MPTLSDPLVTGGRQLTALFKVIKSPKSKNCYSTFTYFVSSHSFSFLFQIAVREPIFHFKVALLIADCCTQSLEKLLGHPPLHQIKMHNINYSCLKSTFVRSRGQFHKSFNAQICTTKCQKGWRFYFSIS